MITAIDTNVLLDILAPNPEYASSAPFKPSRKRLARDRWWCVILSMPSYVSISRAKRIAPSFWSRTKFGSNPLSREASFLASRLWKTYRQEGGKRTRILTDFLVGAHAQVQASAASHPRPGIL